PDVGPGEGDAAARGVFVLVGRPGVVVGDAPGPADVRGVVGGGQLGQPARLGDGVVVDERDHLPGGVGDANVPRLRQVRLGAVVGPHVVGELGEDGVGVVGAGAVDDDDLEVGVGLVFERVERLPQ